MQRLGRSGETTASGVTSWSNTVINPAHLLLDALDVHGEERTRCLGVTRRLLTSSLGASMPMSIATVKRNLLNGYKAFLLGSSSGSNELLEIEIKIQHLENLIARLEVGLLKSESAIALTNEREETLNSNSALSMLIVFTRLIGSSTGQVSRSSIRDFETGSKVNNNQNFKSTMKETTTKSNDFSTMKAPQLTPSASPAEEYTRLVRECIYALQGINGSRIQFRKLKNDTGNVSCDFGGALDVCPRLVKDIAYSGTIRSASSYTNQMDLQRQEPFVTLDAIQLCGECGWLFLCIQKFIHQNIASACDGEASCGRMVARALAEALRDELTDYHSFVARILEEQQQIKPEYLFTLNRLVCMVRNAKMKLHALALLVEDCNKKKKYPAHHFPSVVHVHANLRQASSSISCRLKATSSCDTLSHSMELSKLFNKIAYRTSLPLYHKMFQWVFFGILAQNQRVSPNTTRRQDPELDFFITENISVEDAYLWWESSGEGTPPYTKSREISSSERRSPQLVTPRYSLDQSIIPVFISHEMAQMMLNIGKGVNFVRKCLGDKSWDLMQQLLSVVSNNDLGEPTERATNKESLGFCYGAGDVLQKTLSRCQRIVHSHILTMLFDRHSLQQHLLLMKKCLLLSQGDFVQTLIEGLDNALTKHLSSTWMTADIGIDEIDGGGVALTLPPRYTLQMLVDNALHNTNYFKLLPESFLSRIIVVITSISSSDALDEDREKKSHFKWDVFSLEYSIDAPLTSVVHPVAQTRYQLMFRLIWRCKHIEYMLSKNWRSAVTVHRAVLKICKEEPEREQGALADGSSARAFLRRTAMTRHKAMHFFSNFLSYISYEVIENSWKELDFNLGNAKTLDDIVRSHDLYMKNIVTKSMLLAKHDDHTFEHSFPDSVTTTNDSEERTTSLAMQLTSVLHAAVRFTTAEERVFANALSALEKAAQMRRVAENRLKEKKWGYEKTPSNAMEAAFSDANAAAHSFLISTAEELDLELRKFITNLFRQTDDRGDSNENDDYSHILTEVSPDLELTPTPPGFRQHQFVEVDDQGLKDSLQFLAFRLDFNRYYDKECRS